MFSLREYVKQGCLKAVGRQPDYWIINNSAGWFDKGVLTQADLAEISAAIDAQYSAPPVAEAPEAETDGPVEDSVEMTGTSDTATPQDAATPSVEIG